MADKLKKKVLFELQTDFNKINREINVFEKNLKEAKWAEKEAKAAGDEHKLALIKQQRAVSELKEQRRKANQALRKYNRDQATSNNLASKASEFLKSSAMAYVGLGVAVGGTVKVFKDLISSGIDWAGTVEGVDGRVRELSEKIGNMIPAKGLAKLAEYEKAMSLTTKETEALAAAAVDLSRIAKIDTAQALEKLTRSVTSGSTRALQELGIQTEELTGTKLEKMNYVLGKLTDSMDDTSRSASNAAESMDSFRNRREMAFARLGYAITQTDAFKNSLSALGEVSNTLADYLESLGKAADDLTSRQLEAKKATGDFFRAAAKAAVAAIPFLGQFYALQDKITDKYRESEYKAAHAAAKETEATQARLDAVWKSWQDRQAKKTRAEELADQETSNAHRKAEAEAKRHQAALSRIQRRAARSRRRESRDEYVGHLAEYKRYQRQEERAVKRHNKRVERYAMERFRVEQKLADQRMALAQEAIEREAARVAKEKELYEQRRDMIQQSSRQLLPT